MNVWNPYAPDPGLCGNCANVRIIQNRRGSRFHLCRMSEVDPRFPKYPRLPVLRCRGYEPADDVLVENEQDPAAAAAHPPTIEPRSEG